MHKLDIDLKVYKQDEVELYFFNHKSWQTTAIGCAYGLRPLARFHL